MPDLPEARDQGQLLLLAGLLQEELGMLLLFASGFCLRRKREEHSGHLQPRSLAPRLHAKC